MISKRAEFSTLPDYPEVKNDYVRRVLNHTGVAIRVVDASGRTKKHDPIFRPIHCALEKVLIIEEWFAGTDIDGMVDMTEEFDGMWLSNLGVKMQHKISLEDLAELPDGIFMEECGLQVCLDEYDADITHPRFSSDMKSQLESTCGVHMGIELLDPRKCMTTLYANIGGVVYPVTPKRTPTPANEGILIHTRDSSKNIMDSKLYDIDELLIGEGVQGIRIYRSEIEAREDDRRPDKESLNRLKQKVLKEADAIRDEGIQIGRKEALAEAERIRQAADEKLKRAEDIVVKARQDKHNDRTGLISGIVKVFASLVAFVKVVFT